MKYNNLRWLKRFSISFVTNTIITSIFLFSIQNAFAVTQLTPKICDVTSKQFSVVWTEQNAYSSCGITLYTNASYNVVSTLNPTIIIETPNGHPGKTNRIAKVTVVGLTPNTTYYFKPFADGNPKSGMQVTTERLRGLDFSDPAKTDIVSNDIVHKAVFEADDDTIPAFPALGVLVMANILNSANQVLNDYPVTAWVGENMIGDPSSTLYNPNDISYQQYAALNMNNLFGGVNSGLENHHYFLSLNGGEKIQFIIVHGALTVAGKLDSDTNDWIIENGRIVSVDTINGEKITTAKISTSFRLKTGLNNFALPSEVIQLDANNRPKIYETGDLFKYIKSLGGPVRSIWSFLNGDWYRTYELRGNVRDSVVLKAGTGCFIDMEEGNQVIDLDFYGKPNSASVTLDRFGLNLISFPQLPANYTTKDLWYDLEKVVGDNFIRSIWSYGPGGWNRTYELRGNIRDSQLMSNNKFYFVDLITGATLVNLLDPFAP